MRCINLLKVCGLRSQTWLDFCLIIKKMKHITCNINNKDVAELPFINSNTFVGYLYSRDVVQHFQLSFLGNKHLY